MRCIDGGDGRDQRSRAAQGNRIAAVQPAFGMGDNVYLFVSGFRYNLADPGTQLRSAVGYRCGRLVIAIIDDCAVALQLPGNSAPVVKQIGVPEKNAVDKQERIFGAADLQGFPLPVNTVFFCFKNHFIGYRTDDGMQNDQIDDRNHAAGHADGTVPDAQLDRCGIYAQDAVPEEHCFHKKTEENASAPELPVGSHEFGPQPDMKQDRDR